MRRTFCLLGRQTLGKRIEAAAAFAQAQENYAAKQPQSVECRGFCGGERFCLRLRLTFTVLRVLLGHRVFLYHDVQGGRQEVEAAAAQSEHFAIHHHVHGSSS